MALFDLAVDAILIGNAKGEIIFANKQASILSGFDIQELLNSNINILFSKEERERVPLRYDLLNLGKIVRCERILTRKDRAAVHIDMNTKRMPDGTYQTFIRDISERKKVEEALRQSEEKLRTFTEATLEGIVVSEKGIILDVNNQICEMLGFHKDELIGRPLLDQVANEHLDLVKNAIVRGTTEPYEHLAKRKDGQVFPVQVHAKTMTVGNRTYRISAIRNISDQKKAEKALRENEEKFSKAFKISPDSININRFNDGMYLEINDGFTAMTGYTADDVIGRSSLPDDLGIWVYQKDRDRLLEGLKENGEVLNLEADFRKKNGEILTGSMSARLIEINGEQCILTSTRDITERKLTEAALAAEKERLLVTLRSIGDGVITTDVSGKITLMNPIAEELTGFSLENSLQKPLSEVFNIVNEMSGLACESPVDKVLKTGSIIGLANHTALIHRDGTKRIIADSGVPIRDKANSIIGVVLVFRDITDKQKTEEALLNAQKLESVGLLAGGIAHDFNNLLSGIFGHVDIARMYMQDGDLKRVAVSLSKAMSVFERAKHLTEQLLTFSKGGVPIRKTQSVIKIVRDSIQFVLSGSTVSPVFEIPSDIWLCDFDAHQISQVIDNIAINARQAMPLGGKLLVSIANINQLPPAPLLPTKPYIRISIRDFGAGIAKEYLPKIFDPFFTTKQQGSGLGLATSYSIIKKHDGHISVESELGTGTVFHIFLPAATGQPSINENQLHSPHMGQGRILVMDDEDFILDVASQMLTHMGYEVETVPNGERAIEVIKQSIVTGKRFIVSILDLTIPGGKGGKDTAAEIAALDHSVINIASSGYSEDPIMANPTNFGFAARLVKPYRSEEINQVLEIVLKNKFNKTGECNL